MNPEELSDDEILAELEERRPRRKEPTAERVEVKGMHSESHALAKEVSEWAGEPKKFGRYLGVINRIGLPKAYTVFSELRQSRNEIKNRGALFMYKTRR